MKKRNAKQNIIEEYVPINGIETYFLHFPEESGKPVLLMVHGGPGESAAPMCTYFKKHFGSMCTLVTYDQRGTGRTFLKNPEAKPDLSLMLEDLRQVVAYLRERYGVSKIALLGQSWGSGLGSVYALQHPEDLLCYIGVGQLVNGRKTRPKARACSAKRFWRRTVKRTSPRSRRSANIPLAKARRLRGTKSCACAVSSASTASRSG
jgi:pimeloyl-ACP methyl ester carboxylesterase